MIARESCHRDDVGANEILKNLARAHGRQLIDVADHGHTSGAAYRIEEGRAHANIDHRRFVHDEPVLGKRSEEHTSELQSLMRISYAVFCLEQKTDTITHEEPTTDIT